MSPDDLRELLLEKLLQNAPGVKGNNLENVMLGAKWKPWYTRTWDYTKMGWNLITGQYIWDGEGVFKNLSGSRRFYDIGRSKLGNEMVSSAYPQPASVRPDKIDVMVATCDVDNHQTLVIANDLPENLKYFKESSDYKYIFRDERQSVLAWHAAYATAALPCFQRFKFPHPSTLQNNEYSTRVVDGAATTGLMTQIVEHDKSVVFILNLNESDEKRSNSLDIKTKPKYQTGGLLNYAFNSFMTMLYNAGSMDIRWAIENDGFTLEQYIEIKPSMQSSIENRDQLWWSENPLTTLDFLDLTEEITKKAFWFGHDIVQQRIDYLQNENPGLISEIEAKGVTIIMSGGGARGAILTGAVFAFIEKFGPGVIKAMGGISMGGIISIMMAEILGSCDDFCGNHYEPNPTSTAEGDDRY
jgi:hypothetical protein